VFKDIINGRVTNGAPNPKCSNAQPQPQVFKDIINGRVKNGASTVVRQRLVRAPIT
jgi:hypothetical protein